MLLFMLPLQMWVTLANLPGDPAERQAFARRHLLGKTLATVHLMEARALANVLWALGKLRIDLTKEGQGHYLAGIFEDRVQEVVRRGALKVSRVAEQLWYGITLSGYPWSRELLESLVEKTIPVFTTWELKTQGQVCTAMQLRGQIAYCQAGFGGGSKQVARCVCRRSHARDRMKQ